MFVEIIAQTVKYIPVKEIIKSRGGAAARRADKRRLIFKSCMLLFTDCITQINNKKNI